MPERDANQLAADLPEVKAVREAVLALRLELPPSIVDDVSRRVEGLVALVGTLQQERDAERRWCKHWAERAEAAEAALAEKDAALTNMTGWHNEANRDLRAAEAALAETTNELRATTDTLIETNQSLAIARQALVRVRDNARSWHGVEGQKSGHERALNVIADWCSDALAAVADGDTAKEPA